jgi:hypothetical protein
VSKIFRSDPIIDFEDNKLKILSEDIIALRSAKELLENPGLTAKITNLIGTPIEKGFKLLPKNWNAKIAKVTRDALLYSLKGALMTMGSTESSSYPNWHKFAATVSGGVGGAFGFASLAIELPISTTIMLRSIADIARASGEDLSDADVRLACLEVFALGGPKSSDNAAESGYFAVRAALGRAVSKAAEFLAKKTITEEGAPPLARLIAVIASRYQVQVSEKAAAMAIPAIGAIGGSVINYLFIDHFQNMSRGHFTVRRLERKYTPELIKESYNNL